MKPMIVTGAFFADHVEDQGRKLSITGGVWDYIEVPDGEGTVAARLVVLAQANPDDYSRSNVITTKVYSPDGDQISQVNARIELGAPAENRYFHFDVPFPVSARGRYSFTIDANDENPIAIGLDVRTGGTAGGMSQ